MGVGHGRPKGAVPWGWTLAFAAVFLLLLVSTVRFLAADFLPARHLDPDRTTLVSGAGDRSLLRLTVLHVPEEGQLRYVVRDEDPPRVEIDWTAERRPPGVAPAGAERVLEIALPRTDRVVVLDLRWARREGIEVRAEDAP
jgi:hypothetical protein